RARVAEPDEGRRGDPFHELLERHRAIVIDIPTRAGTARRIVLTETVPRYVAAFGDRCEIPDVVPDALRRPAVTPQIAQRELLVRFVSLAGAVSIDDV